MKTEENKNRTITITNPYDLQEVIAVCELPSSGFLFLCPAIRLIEEENFEYDWHKNDRGLDIKICPNRLKKKSSALPLMSEIESTCFACKFRTKQK